MGEIVKVLKEDRIPMSHVGDEVTESIFLSNLHEIRVLPPEPSMILAAISIMQVNFLTKIQNVIAKVAIFKFFDA